MSSGGKKTENMESVKDFYTKRDLGLLIRGAMPCDTIKTKIIYKLQVSEQWSHFSEEKIFLPKGERDTKKEALVNHLTSLHSFIKGILMGKDGKKQTKVWGKKVTQVYIPCVIHVFFTCLFFFLNLKLNNKLKIKTVMLESKAACNVIAVLRDLDLSEMSWGKCLDACITRGQGLSILLPCHRALVKKRRVRCQK